MFIGDGTSDRFAAAHADVAFAKESLARICEAEGWPFVDGPVHGHSSGSRRNVRGRSTTDGSRFLAFLKHANHGHGPERSSAVRRSGAPVAPLPPNARDIPHITIRAGRGSLAGAGNKSAPEWAVPSIRLVSFSHVGAKGDRRRQISTPSARLPLR